jgi:hypothetical protein
MSQNRLPVLIAKALGSPVGASSLLSKWGGPCLSRLIPATLRASRMNGFQLHSQKNFIKNENSRLVLLNPRALLSVNLGFFFDSTGLRKSGFFEFLRKNVESRSAVLYDSRGRRKRLDLSLLEQTHLHCWPVFCACLVQLLSSKEQVNLTLNRLTRHAQKHQTREPC